MTSNQRRILIFLGIKFLELATLGILIGGFVRAYRIWGHIIFLWTAAALLVVAAGILLWPLIEKNWQAAGALERRWHQRKETP